MNSVLTFLQEIHWTTESSLFCPDKNMLAVASNGLHITLTTREMVLCQFLKAVAARAADY
jgi:hypothetical protein